MRKLADLVELVEDNSSCVILQTKPKMDLELVKLGCFNGTEFMFRIAKDNVNTCTVWSDKPVGTLEEQYRIKKLLIECIIRDFGISL